MFSFLHKLIVLFYLNISSEATGINFVVPLQYMNGFLSCILSLKMMDVIKNLEISRNKLMQPLIYIRQT